MNLYRLHKSCAVQTNQQLFSSLPLQTKILLIVRIFLTLCTFKPNSNIHISKIIAKNDKSNFKKKLKRSYDIEVIKALPRTAPA